MARVVEVARRAAGRARTVTAVARKEGLQGLAQRLARAAYRRSGAVLMEFPLLLSDVVSSGGGALPVATKAPAPGTRLLVAWVTTPPAPGSGGHTTMFRMVEALEAAGHECVLYLYDRYDGDLLQHERSLRRWWPGVAAEVRDAQHGLQPADVFVATSWQTAHVVASRTPFETRRLYLVQDFEPFFYPRGAEYALAEDTYRFGFRCVAVGNMVAGLLLEQCGTESVVAQFGCDLTTYRLTNRGPRTGVVFYARPGTARRGYELAVLALQEFAKQHPDQDIHVFGDVPHDLPFKAALHGRLSPEELNRLYNECLAGLALSFTNISLTVSEMLAAGVVPVVNDHPYARADLESAAVQWARPTPRDLADALSRVVSSQASHAGTAAGSVRTGGWTPAQDTFLNVVESEVWGVDR